MQALLIILLKINIALLLFAAAYYFVLRRLTFYSLNRSFLMFGIIFSSIYPFIDLTELFYQQKKIPVAVTKWIPAINPQVTEDVYWKWMIGAFCIGAVVMAIRLTRQFISLYLLHKRSVKDVINNTEVRIVKEQLSPFSFWKNIYINPTLHKTDELEHIIAHENIHVGQLHTADIILAEISVVFYWFNPGVWLMKKAIKENLEFITDEKVLKTGTDKKSYQYSLLDVGQLKPASTITNSFNLSDLKKRIRMMNARRSSKLTLGRYVFILPLLIFISLAFTIAKKEISQSEAAKESLRSVPVLTTAIAPEPEKNIPPALPERPRAKQQVTAKETSSVAAQNREGGSIRITSTTLHERLNTPASVPAVRQTVIGHRLSDTAHTQNMMLRADPPVNDNVITVQGHPLEPKAAAIQETSRSKDSTSGNPSNANNNVERVVIGYKTPKRNN
ncbi:M56 family metallopeptidase [Terrimonas sp. NA20]|uniref:M56 family metallopeptidase n=1 Tax=Terrimonas ginsenosidimutans TaxID=2908004 RepID=A0ABS9KP02_9BACT|nr:M56 family metallopeptidase [Terrimonas ginsenosidimutans]MCG2614059.1 M56 family metallopeptidase [Terrimonas ginsenosidimutans]